MDSTRKSCLSHHICALLEDTAWRWPSCKKSPESFATTSASELWMQGPFYQGVWGGLGTPSSENWRKLGGLPQNLPNPCLQQVPQFHFRQQILILALPLCTCRIPSVNSIFTHIIKKWGGQPPRNWQSSEFFNCNSIFLNGKWALLRKKHIMP